MKQADTYTSRPFDLHGLDGISDRTIEMHMKLYDGYIRETNCFTHPHGDFGWPSQKWDGGVVSNDRY